MMTEAFFQMRRLILLTVFLAWIPARATKQVTIEQLEQICTRMRVGSDAAAAKQLSELELSERLNSIELLHIEKELPGPESRRALGLVADLSAFLDPPATDIPLVKRPDLATQRQIIARTVDYVTNITRQLPNFLAARSTTRFVDTPMARDEMGV